MMFKLTGPLSVHAIFGTDSSKSQLLTEWNRSLTMLRVATVHKEVLMFVRRFDIQVGTD